MSTIYDVLRRPLVTEKSNYQSSKLHQYVFEVAADATRTLVKDAVEQIFDVTVVAGERDQCSGQAVAPCAQPPVGGPPHRLQKGDCYPGARRQNSDL